ncbi:hypothetical protein [Aliivibrio wodanis]|jgi:hypothetical protein
MDLLKAENAIQFMGDHFDLPSWVVPLGVLMLIGFLVIRWFINR